jgi:hypothetical protein
MVPGAAPRASRHERDFTMLQQLSENCGAAFAEDSKKLLYNDILDTFLKLRNIVIVDFLECADRIRWYLFSTECSPDRRTDYGRAEFRDP